MDIVENNHMICHPSLSFDINDCYETGGVHLPNGSKLPIMNVGRCKLDHDMIKNVLCFSSLKFNLLFVAKLTRELNCVSKFLS